MGKSASIPTEVSTATKVGILMPSFDESSGGGHTYVQAIKSAIQRSDFSGDYQFISYEELLANRHQIGADDETNGENTSSNILNRFLKNQNFDALWILFPLGGAVYPSIPFAITVWDIAHRYFPYFPEIANGGWNAKSRDEYYTAMLGQASLILTGNERGKSELLQNYRFPEERVLVVPLPAPALKPTKNTGPMTRRKVQRIFYPAQFWAHKNHYNAILAVKIVIDSYKLPVELIFTGADHGNKTYIENGVRELGLSDHVKFLGLVSKETIANLYETSDILLYLSLFGPDNLPPLEAFAAGCPVIASDHPGHREQLRNAAVFVDPLDPNIIAKKISEVLTDEKLRQTLVCFGQAIALERTPDDYIKKVHIALKRIARLRKLWN